MFLFLLLPMAAMADGMVIPTIALPAKVTIPDQRALIHFTNGTERLVIETRFTGSGTNFAWVVPFPSQPVIEETSTGLFPTLQYLFRPQITYDAPHYYLEILLLMGIVYLLRLAAKSVWNAFVIAIIFLPIVVLLLSALAAGKRRSASMGSISVASRQDVSILDRKIIGIFETTTIASRDVKALQTWLTENGFVVPTNSESVIESYVKDGWVFVTSKIRRDNANLQTSTPNPLSFTFKTEKPVYPMRLTGLNSQKLNVELYVFGSGRAKAPHFKIESCTQPNYPELPSKDMLDWRRWSPETPDIVHPLLRKWVDGSPVATKLAATLSPADMRQDVWLEWTPFSEKKNHSFSTTGAWTIAANWASGAFAAGLLAAWVLTRGSQIRGWSLLRLAGAVAISSIVLSGLIYIVLPKTEVRLAKYQIYTLENAEYELGFELKNANLTNLAAMSMEAKRLLANPLVWSDHHNPKIFDNFLLGGQMHEEDSPGNYTIREAGGRLEFVAYDAEGAEHVQTLGD